MIQSLRYGAATVGNFDNIFRVGNLIDVWHVCTTCYLHVMRTNSVPYLPRVEVCCTVYLVENTYDSRRCHWRTKMHTQLRGDAREPSIKGRYYAFQYTRLHTCFSIYQIVSAIPISSHLDRQRSGGKPLITYYGAKPAHQDGISTTPEKYNLLSNT